MMRWVFSPGLGGRMNSVEKLADKADELYGATAVSNYQGQGLKLSKHFRDFGAE